mmetsp:Transcript_2428/g.5163  ORF Transcript_2428/g.5163 Transcript_2428/m.5163 type:complete len:129 (-) Transcript_2428:15-401(-)
MLQKGMAGVVSLSQSLWSKKATAIALKEQVMERMTSTLSSSVDPHAEDVHEVDAAEEAPTFEREAAPPVTPACISSPANASHVTTAAAAFGSSHVMPRETAASKADVFVQHHVTESDAVEEDVAEITS